MKKHIITIIVITLGLIGFAIYLANQHYNETLDPSYELRGGIR